MSFSEDYGTITNEPIEIIDGGSICSCETDNIISVDNQTSTTVFVYYSTGESTKKVFNVTGSSRIRFEKIFDLHIDLNDDSIVFLGIILTWIGFGTVFEIENGLERSLSPNLVAGKSL
jgi:hypothetical protein